jgi:hypothetical protein
VITRQKNGEKDAKAKAENPPPKEAITWANTNHAKYSSTSI